MSKGDTPRKSEQAMAFNNKKIAIALKLVFLACSILLPVSMFLSRTSSISSFELLGSALGLCWMIYNFFGFLFDRDMSMRGRLPKANSGSDSSIRRVLTFFSSLGIYFMLVYYISGF
jgi:hypothetical protein